jgi:hypothetical protein
VWRATTVVEVGAGVGATGDPAAWLAKEREALLSEPVLAEAVAQLNQRGVRQFEGPDDMRGKLAAGMGLAFQPPNRLVIELRDTNREQVVSVLESLTRGFLAWQMAQERHAPTPLATQMLQPPARDPGPVVDYRLHAAAGVFVAAALAGLLLATIVRWWLRRAAKVMAGPAPPAVHTLEDPAAWPPVPPARPTVGPLNDPGQ